MQTLKVLSSFDRAIQRFPNEKDATLFERPSQGTWKERFSIYVTGYGVRSLEAMEDIFELFPKRVGSKKWKELIQKYNEQYPSRSYTFADMGEPFEKFLKEIRAPKMWQEVARFELLIWAVFHAKEKPLKTDPQDYLKMNENTIFQFQAAATLFESSWTCARAWLHRHNRPRLQRKKERVLIFRKEDDIFIRFLPLLEYQILKQLKEGKTLGMSLKKLSRPIQPNLFSQWLREWLQQGIVVNYLRK